MTIRNWAAALACMGILAAEAAALQCPASVYLQGAREIAVGPAVFESNGGYSSFNLDEGASKTCSYSRSALPGYYDFIAAYFPPGTACAMTADGKGFECGSGENNVVAIPCPDAIAVGPVKFIGKPGAPMSPLPRSMKASGDKMTLVFKSVEIWPKYGERRAPAMRCNYGDFAKIQLRSARGS